MKEHRRADLPAIAPNQYAVGECCEECKRPLSRYNCYTVCGPCRVRMFMQRNVGLQVLITAHGEGNRFNGPAVAEYHAFPQRTPVRRGPLLTEDGMVDEAG